jgi:Protein of unknown function (DUF3300)
MSKNGNKNFGRGAAALATLVFVWVALGQPAPDTPAPPSTGSAQRLTAQQLDDLVAPVALYPDPLLGEVLAASTYPFGIAEAEQWVHDHLKWKPSKLMDEAKKQSWDPSIQGLVAFPQVLAHLSQDTAWTTALGDAFLAQQSDVMQSVQRMRVQAQANGKLQSTPQESVTASNRGGNSVIDIEPADPDVWYVPNYNPSYVWGPPAFGYYPALLYPGLDVGFGWYPGIDLGLYFGGWGGWGWGGWGWSPDWYGGGIIVNQSFFHRYGFHHFHGNGQATSTWAHDRAHRIGVPYANSDVASRFAAQSRNRAAFGGPPRAGSLERLGSPGFEQRGYTGNHSVFGGYHGGEATRLESDHGFSSLGAGRIGGFGGGGFHGGGFGGGGFHGGGGRR